ncbi:hypothetical protein ACEWY4_010268 [Coilia grayii]|uniref:Anoctamin n=1 Tax=Coilia grayii TaxID=363190 RepID=A0ABD1K1L0_9TELE
MILVTFSAVSAVILYRVCVFAVMSMNPDPEAKANVRVTVTTTAVVINLLIVLVLDEIYDAIAGWITELEIPKTEAAFEEHLIIKAFWLKSMNAFAPVFYVAFFKGRFAGRPGDYVYVFNDFRMEECAPSGCLIEVCIQLCIIMLGKQLIQNNVFEIAVPKLKKMYREYKEKEGALQHDTGDEPNKEPQPWEKDYNLEPYEGLSPEYMEMVIQYGFVTLFVASFPLAPVFALLNNVIEIRLDAAKFITEVRRPDAVRAKEIGIWYNILNGISKFAVITNAFVISFTSEFIPRMVYQYIYSETGTMHGYTDYTLSYFNTSNFKPGTAPNATQYDKDLRICRYKDYRDPPWSPESYQLSKQYWSVLAARLAFVIFFQNLAMFLSMLVAWLIPNVPHSLKDQIKRERAALMELLLSQEHTKTSGRPPASRGANIITRSPLEEEKEEEQPGGESSRSGSPSLERETDLLEERDNQGGGLDPDLDPDPGLDGNQDLSENSDRNTNKVPCGTCKGTSERSRSKLVYQKSLNESGPLEGSKDLQEGAESTRTKPRCRTLPSRHREPDSGHKAARSSHSSVFTHLSQQVSPSCSQLTNVRQSSQSELARSIIKNCTKPPSQPPSRTPSDSELIQKSISRPPSQSEISGSTNLALSQPLSRPPSGFELSQSAQRSFSRQQSEAEVCKASRKPFSRPSSRAHSRPPSDLELAQRVQKSLSRPSSEAELAQPSSKSPSQPPSRPPSRPPSDIELAQRILKSLSQSASQAEAELASTSSDPPSRPPSRPPSDAELARRVSKPLSHPPSIDELSQSTSKPPPQPPSESKLAWKSLSRDPSLSEQSENAPKTLSRPPFNSELASSSLAGPPASDRKTRAKGRCQTLPPNQQPPETGEPAVRTSHSTTFTHLSQQVPPSCSELTQDTETMGLS